jgi:hypothetical protein
VVCGGSWGLILFMVDLLWLEMICFIFGMQL